MTHAPVELTLPFSGRWTVQNSPARRVPSHGTDLMGERYAIDFVGVDDRGRTASTRDWRTVLATEPPERYAGFGRPILAPADGTVVVAADTEPDHAGRRSQLALVPYTLGQASRVRRSVAAVAGNHVIVALAAPGAFVALVHQRSGSVGVRPGDTVTAGQPLAECGNSGNSTEPHLHLQAMDSADLGVARGLPVVFRGYREWVRGSRHPLDRPFGGIPLEGAIVEPLPR